MKPALLAEVRKLFSVRSTYVLTGIALLLVIFFAGYVSGWRAAETVDQTSKLSQSITGAANLVTIFAAIIAVLLMTHEYRYGTITYTLTLARSRTQILLAKILVISGFSVVFALLVSLLSPIATQVGIALHGLDLVPQTISFGDVLWRSIFYCWSFSMIALLLAALLRNQLATLIGLFVAPSTIEPLLTLLLKDNAIYLPFHAQQAVLTLDAKLLPGHAALTTLAYLILGWIVAWLLFQRRDAN